MRRKFVGREPGSLAGFTGAFRANAGSGATSWAVRRRVPDVPVVDHNPKCTSDVYWAFVRSMGSCLIVGSAYHKNTNAKVERANGVIGDTLRALANGRKDDWDRRLPLAVFAINNAA